MENKSILGTILSLVIVVVLLGSFLAPTIAAYQYETGTVEYNDAADAGWLRLNYGDDDFDVTFTIDSSDLIVNDQTGAANDMIVYADESSCILCNDGALVIVNGYADTPAVVSADAVTIIKSDGQIQITADDVTVVSAVAPAWAYYPDENGHYSFINGDVENVVLKQGNYPAFAGSYAGVMAYNDYVVGPNGVGDLGLALNADIVDNVINSVTWSGDLVLLDSRAINPIEPNNMGERGEMLRSADPTTGTRIGDLYYTFNGSDATVVGYSSEIDWATFTTIPDTVTNGGVDYNVTSIGNYAFRYCTNLALTSLPSGITSIGQNAFEGCTNLALTSLPSGVTSIKGYTFKGCTNLALTSLPSGVTSIGLLAFTDCTNLALTSLPSGVTTIRENAFQNCTNLALTSLPSGVTSINALVFQNCTNLALTSLPSGVTSIGNWAFDGCTNLALTSLPSGVTSIGGSAFKNCTNLALTSLPSELTFIGGSAFQNCTNLALTSLPSGLATIQNNAFNGCTNLALTSLPSELTSLSNNAFAGCTNLESLIIQSSPTISGTPFDNTSIKEVLNLGSTEITTTSYGLNADEVRSDVPAMGYVAPLTHTETIKKTDAASELLSVILLTTIGGVVLALIYTTALRRD